MLTIRIKKESYRVEMEGHCNYAEKGKDIVCSAASILFYTLAETLNRFKEALVFANINIKPDEKDAIQVIECKPKPQYEPNIQIIFQTILIGFELLADGYQDNIKLEVV